MSLVETVIVKDRQFDYEDFLWLPNFVFKFIGYHVIEKPKSRVRRNMDNVIFVTLLIVHLVEKYFMYAELVMLLGMGDFINGIRIACYVAYSIDANIKFVALNLNLGRARQMNLLLEQVFPKTQRERHMYNVNRHYWYRSTRIVLCIYFIAAFFIALAPLLNSISIYMLRDTLYGEPKSAIFPYYKPIPMAYGNDCQTLPCYTFIYVFECAYIHFTTITNVGTDLWLIHYVAQICMHMHFIKRVLKEHEPGLHTFQRDAKILAQLIRKHQLMYYLTAELNSMFGISLAFTLLATTGLLCVLAVRLSFEKLNFFFCILLTFLLIVLMQFFLVCKYGQLLIDVSQNIAWAAYEQKWYDASHPYKKLLLILMVRAQKQADIVAKAFQAISMETLKMVVSMTYRVFTVINTMIN